MTTEADASARLANLSETEALEFVVNFANEKLSFARITKSAKSDEWQCVFGKDDGHPNWQSVGSGKTPGEAALVAIRDLQRRYNWWNLSKSL